jgi:hypothetical protein
MTPSQLVSRKTCDTAPNLRHSVATRCDKNGSGCDMPATVKREESAILRAFCLFSLGVAGVAGTQTRRQKE